MYNNIIEKRTVNDGIHCMVLEISGEEYNNVYEEYSDEIALEILNNYLENRGDDGRPSDVKIKYEKHNDMIKISANLHYLGNDHTG